MLRPGEKYLVWNSNKETLTNLAMKTIYRIIWLLQYLLHTQLLWLAVKPSMIVHSILGLYFVSLRVIPIRYLHKVLIKYSESLDVALGEEKE